MIEHKGYLWRLVNGHLEYKQTITEPWLFMVDELALIALEAYAIIKRDALAELTKST